MWYWRWLLVKGLFQCAKRSDTQHGVCRLSGMCCWFFKIIGTLPTGDFVYRGFCYFVYAMTFHPAKRHKLHIRSVLVDNSVYSYSLAKFWRHSMKDNDVFIALFAWQYSRILQITPDYLTSTTTASFMVEGIQTEARDNQRSYADWLSTILNVYLKLNDCYLGVSLLNQIFTANTGWSGTRSGTRSGPWGMRQRSFKTSNSNFLETFWKTFYANRSHRNVNFKIHLRSSLAQIPCIYTGYSEMKHTVSDWFVTAAHQRGCYPSTYCLLAGGDRWGDIKLTSPEAMDNTRSRNNWWRLFLVSERLRRSGVQER